MKYEIWTDGACVPNPGRGGWGVVIKDKEGTIKEFSGYVDSITTSSRMEVFSAIMALSNIPDNSDVTIFSDSSYLVLTFSKGRLKKWKSNPRRWYSIKNKDLWLQLEALVEKQNSVKWELVRGHSNIKYNNRCDELAGQAIDNKKGIGVVLPLIENKVIVKPKELTHRIFYMNYYKSYVSKRITSAVMFSFGDGREVYFSYNTVIGFKDKNGKLYVISNIWGRTMKKHIDCLDPKKTNRVSEEVFSQKFREEFGVVWENGRETPVYMDKNLGYVEE